MMDRSRITAFVFLIFAVWSARASAQERAAVDVLPTDRVLFCQTGTALHLAGACPFSQWTQESRLEIDRQVVARSSSGAMDGPYAFTWTASAAGLHTVEVTYLLDSGERAVARHLTLRVLDEAPIDWEDGPRDADTDYCVALRRAPLKEFRVAQSHVMVDGQSESVDPLDFTAVLPGASLVDGVHRASIEAFDREGNRYVSPPSSFGVPPRIVFPSPGALIVRAAGSTVALRAKVSPLWTPINITYYVNDTPVASADHAPFLAHADLSAYDSGTYFLKAVAVDEAGHIAETTPVQTAIINIPRERAAEARAQAQQPVPSESEQATRSLPNLAPLRDEKSSGTGEAMISGVAAGLNSDGTELIGLPITVRANLRRGTGQLSLTGIAGDGAINAAQAAASWLRGLPEPIRDWSGWDLILTADADQSRVAPDGVTDGLALYAASTDQIANRSIIALGNIADNGEIIPIGNLMTKAEAALSRPGIQTLIVPNSPATSEELGVLKTMKPALFDGKRIVIAQTMTDVVPVVFGARVTAKSKPHHILPSVRQIQPLPPLEAPTSPAPPAAAPRASRPAPDEDPLNAQLDRWQALYEKNAGTIQSLASQLLHGMGGK